MVVELDGTITYGIGQESSATEHGGDGISTGGETGPGDDPAGCDQTHTSAIRGVELDGSLNMYVGDGGQPAAGTQSDSGSAIGRASDNWYYEQSPCFGSDQSSAPRILFAGTTTNEGDFVTVNGDTSCGSRDSKSTLDTGNLDSAEAGSPIAMNCTWSEGGSTGTIVQSDVRFNTYNMDFTYHPNWDSCDDGSPDPYDVEGILTHELGHSHGLVDQYEHGVGVPDRLHHQWQTMWGYGRPCDGWQRSLGEADVWAIRAQY